MIETTAGEIAAITGGMLHDCAPATPVAGPVEFDSRQVTPGCVFLALPGARADGHDFAAGAVADGAALVIAAHPVGAPAVVVEPLGAQTSNSDAFAHDPDGSGAAVLEAVGRLARRNVDELAEGGLTVVGVTGSAGKTSTKDMMATILRTAGETVAPKGSFNNEIGHPYTVLRCTRDTRYLVAELSARGVGHVAHLARIAPPRIGAVLNVGTAHIGEFGSREVIAQAKGELIEALPDAADGGVAVLNADDPLVAGMAPRTRAKVVTFGLNPGADYRATAVELDDVARASFTLHTPDGGEYPVRLRVHGAHQVPNALAAAAVAVEAGLDPAAVAGALNDHVAASARRMEVSVLGDGVTVIVDSYNANPDSMRAGVDALARTTAARDGATSWAVLGQMGELGDGADTEHADLAHVLVKHGVGKLIAVGEGDNVRALAEEATRVGLNTLRAPNPAAAADAVAEGVRPGDVVLVKASYADGLWRVVEALEDHLGKNNGEAR